MDKPASKFVYKVKGAAAATGGPADEAAVSPGGTPKFDPALYSFACEVDGEESADVSAEDAGESSAAGHAAHEGSDNEAESGDSSGVQPGSSATPPLTPPQTLRTPAVPPASATAPFQIPAADFAAALAPAPAQQEAAWPEVARLLCELGVQLARQEQQQKMVLTELALLGERMKRTEADVRCLAAHAPASGAAAAPADNAPPARAPVRVRRTPRRSWGLCCGRADDVMEEKDVKLTVAPGSGA